MANNSHSFKALDGYSMSSTDGYNFVTPWIDCWSIDMVSLNAVFSGASISNGTLKLQLSNDRESTGADTFGRKFPVSAGSSIGNPTDVIDNPSTNEGTESVSITATGTYNLIQYHFPSRWIRASFTKTGAPNTSTVVDVFVHRKQSGG